MQTHVFHIYHDIRSADDVVDRLLASGIVRPRISILTTEVAGSKFLAVGEGTRAEEGGNIGTLGGAVGLIDGGLITAATVGVGVLAVGPLLMRLARLGAGSAAGSLEGTLIRAGIPKADARLYAQEVREKDAILMGVEVTETDRNLVRQIMVRKRETLSIKPGA